MGVVSDTDDTILAQQVISVGGIAPKGFAAEALRHGASPQFLGLPATGTRGVGTMAAWLRGYAPTRVRDRSWYDAGGLVKYSLGMEPSYVRLWRGESRMEERRNRTAAWVNSGQRMPRVKSVPAATCLTFAKICFGNLGATTCMGTRRVRWESSPTWPNSLSPQIITPPLAFNATE